MAESVKIISVFVASPGDVLDERNAVQAVVNELNASLCPSLGVRIEVLRWEKDAVPGFGDDAQDVINKSIGDKYDVFVGILANRFGTATNRADSGTSEEFERAYARFKQDSESVKLMIYFNEEPVSANSLDLAQLSKVRKFREDLSGLGGLYRTYEGIEQFETLFRGHLTKTVVELSKKYASTPMSELDEASLAPDGKSAESSKDDPSNQTFEMADLANLNLSDAEEDFGLLDYAEIYENQNQLMIETLEELTQANERFTQQLTKRKADFERLGAMKPGPGLRTESRRVLKLTAMSFSELSGAIETKLVTLADAREKAFNALTKGISIQAQDFSGEREELEELRNKLAGYEGAATGARENFIALKDSVDALPRMSVELNKSRRELSSSFENLQSEISSHIVSASDIRSTIEGFLE